MAAVVFSPTAFKARYPEFNAVSDARLSLFFDEATLYLSNQPNSIVQNETKRSVLLNMLTAHIAFIGGALGASGQPTPVGRVSNASEGSVSAALDYGVPYTAAWFAQSQYGASFWQATLSIRSFRYIANPTRW